MQGTIVKVAVEDGATVEAGDLIVVLEAMKMEQPITAHKAGTISGLSAEVGAAVTSGAVICTIADAAVVPADHPGRRRRVQSSRPSHRPGSVSVGSP